MAEQGLIADQTFQAVVEVELLLLEEMQLEVMLAQVEMELHHPYQVHP
jgi:hypothetical protein